MLVDKNRTAVVNSPNAMPSPKRKDPAAVALGREGGSKATDLQRQAARRNGLLGGRPKKVLEKGEDRKAG